MKYIALVLAMAAALIGGLAYSGGAANAGGETRLRAFLSTPAVDPFALNVADFRQRADRASFSTEVHGVAELGTGKVIVTRVSDMLLPTVMLETPIVIVLDPLRGTGVGHLDLDSRLGDFVPVLIAGDTVEVLDVLGELIRTGTLMRRD